jgi:hypothetical protein
VAGAKIRRIRFDSAGLKTPPAGPLFARHPHGLPVTPHDSDALSSAIDRILTEPSLASRLSTAAKQSVSERCSKESFVRSSTEFYQACIDRHNSGRSCPLGRRHR